MASSSMLTKDKTTKLFSVRNRRCFKKQTSLSSVSKKTTNLPLREQTMFKKASELSILCDVEVCVIYYNRDGELVRTWPEDQSKVRDMAERFSKLDDRERRKKSTDLSLFLNKKTLKDKKTSFDITDNKCSEKVLEMEASLESSLRVLQDKLLRLQNQTEPDQNHVVSSVGFFTTDPSLMSGVSKTEQDLSTPSLTQQQQSKVSVFLYNHDNDSLCQLPNSISTFDPSMSTASLGAQGLCLRSNESDLLMVFPPQMQTQTPPPVHFDRFAGWNNQTPSSFADPMIFSSYN
ncbi:PREDICTED: agamous-like MADS-box protein AGL93 [Camelina sativa]|uniref:Agamous-like MADS-box protein AGL93 n=1 Tax=Camelina sativa TaxID=90675 RepID=A0ABM0VER2_CAMSA|nr:PREDICTED: agamous-like MADS-box protein AGL93 [Camelina sativa]